MTETQPVRERGESARFDAAEGDESILWARINWSHSGSRSSMSPLSREVAAQMRGTIRYVEGQAAPTSRLSALRNRVSRLLGSNPAQAPWAGIRAKVTPFYSETSWLLENAIADAVARDNPGAVLLESIEDQLFVLAQR